VADILRTYEEAYRRSRGSRLSPAERKALRDLTRCRTSALGGHAWECQDCGHVQVCYNSCRNRHCPTCGGPARAKWLNRLTADLLPTHYFHLVFTLPHELSRLALANRREVYGLLFQAAWEALRDMARDPQHLGAQVGAVMVLHTWGQNLEHHPHVHCVTPGGGLSPDGKRWVPSRSPRFFLDVFVLGERFRAKFLAGLKRLHRKGELKLEEKLAELSSPSAFLRWLRPLAEKNWVVFCEAAPEGVSGPDAVLKYLARYVAGTAISDHRLLAHDGGQVTFRIKDYRQGRKRDTLSLSGLEFVRRFCLHVLPKGLVRVRSFGLMAPGRRRSLVAQCRKLLAQRAANQSPAPSAPTSPEPLPLANPDAPPRGCCLCGSARLTLISEFRGFTWREPPPIAAPTFVPSPPHLLNSLTSGPDTS
jgi:hypothetical protein